MQKFGPINQITGKKMSWTCGFFLFCIHTSDLGSFFLFTGPLASSRETWTVRHCACQLEGGWPHPSAHIHKADREWKGARRRIISQTLTKMWPCGLSVRLHEFSIPSLPNWHPGVKTVQRPPPSPGTIDGLIRAAHRLVWYSLPMIYETVVKSECRHKGTKYDQ